MSSYFTRSGDDGTTGLLGEGRVPKHHPRPEALGTLDEASAALGLARAVSTSSDLQDVVKRVQRDLYAIMAEVAAPPKHAERFRTLDGARVDWLEATTERFGATITLPEGFILPGDSLAGAAFDLARTVVRRAERQVARLHHEGELGNPHLLQYLNRLSSLCFVLELAENQRAGVDSPSLAGEPGE